MRTVGIDVGGTFTDVFLLDDETGEARVAKVPTTRPDQSGGFLAGLREVSDDPAAIAAVVHGTTAGTNALLERKGAAVGVITTVGFRDALEMRRRDRPRTWGLRGEFDPIVPRDRRLEVPERTLSDGTVREPVDVDAVRGAAETLRDTGCEALVVLFVNAYANPENERLAVEAARAVWPNAHVAASHEVLPEIREFERFSTTALNAYLQPEVGGYIDHLEGALRGDGFKGPFLIVQSNGGVMDAATARARPVRTALSGPAAGVTAAAHIAVEAGYPNVITGDVGGTSFDVSLIADGRPATAAQTSIDFGLVVRTPMTEIVTIGAGGGSIAWVDRGGLLRVGPESAGSTPGPVAYGRGNDRPTVTDANVVLGRIDAERPIGGALDRLDVDAARAALASHVGEPLGLDAEAAAEAVLRVANAAMAGAIRLVSIERGHDPKRFAFMPFGGGGGLHAGALMREVGLARSIVPRFPGVTSALGCTIADMRQDAVRTLNVALDALDEAGVNAEIGAIAAEGLALLDGAGTRFVAREVRVGFDMAYAGQTHTIAVEVASGEGAPRLTRAAIRAAFEAAYRAAYGRLLPGGMVRALNLRVAVIGTRPSFDLATLAPGPDASEEAARRGTRAIHFGERWFDASVHDRLALPVGARVEGPAVLEQPDTTIIVDPGLAATVDRFGNVILEGA